MVKKLLAGVLALAILMSMVIIPSLADGEVTTVVVDAFSSLSESTGPWISNNIGHPNYCAAVFGAAAPFCGISALSNWASNPGNPNHEQCTVNVSLFEYDGFSYETSISGTPLQTTVYEPAGDGHPFNWNFGSFYPADEYVFAMNLVFDPDDIYQDGLGMTNYRYFVFPNVLSEPFPAGTVYYPTIKFPFSITFQESNVESYFTPVDVAKKEVFTTDSEGGVTGYTWLASDANNTSHPFRTHDVVINPNRPIEAVGVSNFWASDPGYDSTHVKAKLKISVYEYYVDCATSVLRAPVAYASHVLEGNDNAHIPFESAGYNAKLTNYILNEEGNAFGTDLVFDEPLPAGQYVVRFENISEEVGECYIVLPVTEEQYPNNKASYYVNGTLNTGITTKLHVRFFETGLLSDLIPEATTNNVVLAANELGSDPRLLNVAPVGLLVSVPAGYSLLKFIGTGSPTWGNIGTGSNAKAEVFAWRGDYASSISDAVLATGAVTDHKDNHDAVFLFDKQVTEGMYLIVLSTTSTGNFGFWYGPENTNQNIIKTFIGGYEQLVYPRSSMVLVAKESAPNPVDPEPFFIGDIEIKNASITLKNSIAVNLKLDPAAFVAGYYTDPTATVTINGRTATLTANENYVFTLEDIGPEELGDNITVIVSAKHNGDIVTTEPLSYSVKDYLVGLIGLTDDAQLKTLAVDLLKYGAAAQVYTNHNTDELVTDDLPAEILALGTSTASTLTAGGKGISNTGIAASATWISAGLNLEDDITVKFMFAADDVDGLSVKFGFKNEEYEVTADKFKAVGSGRYVVYFDGVYANEMRELVTATVYSGNTAVSETATYSVEAYAYVKGAGNDVLADLVNAMMVYGDSAAAIAD